MELYPLTGLPDMSVCGDSEDLAPSNPFLETEEKETPLDVALQVLQVFFISFCTVFVFLNHISLYTSLYRILQPAERQTSIILQIKGGRLSDSVCLKIHTSWEKT